MIRVEMLSTGDEVLHGQIIDTNAAWLADYLFNQGLPINSRETVGDSLSALIEVLTERSQVADVLIVNGGLGPTSDDLSALAAARAAGTELVEHPEWIARMEAFFHERGRVMSATNRKQAHIPANAEMLDNPVGTACGFALRLNKCLMFFTPGVPSEFKVMVEQQIMPRLRQHFDVAEPPLCLRMTTFGRSESDLAQELDPLRLPDGVVLGYRSSAPIIELKLTGPASQHQAMEQVWQQVREVAGDSTLFEGTQGLPALLAEQLNERGLRLAVSEQFTAGLMNWQLQSAGVPLAGGELLPAHCQETLEEIACRAQSLSMLCGAQVVLAVGAMQNDHLSVALYTPEGTFAQTVRYQASRHGLRIRQESSAMLALDMVRRWLNGRPVCGQHGWLDVVNIL
ncbi:nicotinamide mononucleotide deamidase-related protein YfaY [Yersinia intermedia]|jgi:competence/damage-inducible protein CinA-like protein|uniref:CinA-like protein n=1 Tax=Yersinia intermedia TaxID=631 RepID=A0A208ZIS7_YERIN|nr:nicotinamide mononucleotide deamidase-related protein YfaY [Yersinia intermedia]MCB5311998.1 nicotinamide mononucleotide deamidase-related protein YfaY [Yersinia intermedia]MCB5324715.1 nicotinamide mononucleotide deamidase-related protein YfaY [Yersinia intermedia]MCB5325276.1 nicotinamide mononucleotide deamidase-related protein YfaY [Yersinia intermedia]OVZ80362.1 competence/damage-inducible protein A [Yersinia intermedia]UNK24725.1 nicotinamide mononucleotide deamidase-related protein Y